MITKRPVQANSTNRLIGSILPASFKMVSDKTSNGYKFINLLYGVEIDEIVRRMKTCYEDSFITSIDLTKDFDLYQVTISGTPNDYLLNKSGNIKIKITDEDEFYNGSPTRLIPIDAIEFPMQTGYFIDDYIYISGFKNTIEQPFISGCSSWISGIMGLEYYRKDLRGSGYFLIASDINQFDAYNSGLYPVFALDVGTNFQDSGDIQAIYGIFTGINQTNLIQDQKYEILSPIDSNTLSGLYPMTREVINSGTLVYEIDHYTPYHGFTFDINGTVIPVLDYQGDYYFDSNGKKIYYRTAKNNPYGFENYSKAYTDLNYTPVSGTLHLYDIDILDSSGNATEIPSNGKALYYLKSDRMLTYYGTNNDGSLRNPDAQSDPIYLGYDTTVPSGRGFSPYMEGKATNYLKTTTWEYLHDGIEFDEGTLNWIDGTGLITNKIAISGYQSRYMVEYKYKTYDQIKCLSSTEKTYTLSMRTTNPLYTTYTKNGNLINVPFEFTKDDRYNIKDSNGLIKYSEATKVLTFDGIKIRPYKKLYQISFNLPVLIESAPITSMLYKNINKGYIGYTNEFVPDITIPGRNYIMNCIFNQSDGGLTFNGSNPIFKTNYGKKIINTVGNSYYYQSGIYYPSDYKYFSFDFKLKSPQNGTLMENYDPVSGYINISFDDKGKLSVQYNDYIFYGNENLKFNELEKHLVIKYVSDSLTVSVPIITIYFKQQGDFGYHLIRTSSTRCSVATPIVTELKLFKNMSIDIESFKIYYEED